MVEGLNPWLIDILSIADKHRFKFFFSQVFHLHNQENPDPALRKTLP